MRLASVREGDIVNVAGSHYFVIGKPGRGKLLVQGICAKNVARVRADEVVKHWRAARVAAKEAR